MKHATRITLLVMLLAALPLRGYAGVTMALCESHHGGAAAAEEPLHGHSDSHHHDSDADTGGSPHAASVCSVCASCCAGAGLAPVTNHGIAFQMPSAFRIPYFDCQVSGFVPEHLERPPLAL